MKGWKTEKYKDAGASYGTAWRDKQNIFPVTKTIYDKYLGGQFFEFTRNKNEIMIMKSEISFVGTVNAQLNLETQTSSFSFDFDADVKQTKNTWNDKDGNCYLTI